jgi:hypothetical protein
MAFPVSTLPAKTYPDHTMCAQSDIPCMYIRIIAGGNQNFPPKIDHSTTHALQYNDTTMMVRPSCEIMPGQNLTNTGSNTKSVDATACTHKDDWLLNSDSEADHHKRSKNCDSLSGQISIANSVRGFDHEEWTLFPRTLDLGDVYFRQERRKSGREGAVAVPVMDPSLTRRYGHVNSAGKTGNNTRQKDAASTHFACITNNSSEIMTFCVCFQPKYPTDPRVFSVSGDEAEACHAGQTSEHLVSIHRHPCVYALLVATRLKHAMQDKLRNIW